MYKDKIIFGKGKKSSVEDGEEEKTPVEEGNSAVDGEENKSAINGEKEEEMFMIKKSKMKKTDSLILDCLQHIHLNVNGDIVYK